MSRPEAFHSLADSPLSSDWFATCPQAIVVWLARQGALAGTTDSSPRAVRISDSLLRHFHSSHDDCAAALFCDVTRTIGGIAFSGQAQIEVGFRWPVRRFPGLRPQV